METTISEFLTKYGKCDLGRYNQDWTFYNDKVIVFMSLSRAEYLEAKDDDDVMSFKKLPASPAKKGKNKPREAFRMSYMA